MKETTKRTVKNVFASLIKNDSAIDGAKTAPWWIAVIMFIIGTFLPIIPIMVNNSKTYGAQYISSNVYGFEQGLATETKELKEKGYSFKVEGNSLIARYNDELINTTYEEVDGVSKDETPLATYETIKEGVKQYSFQIYYSDRPYSKGSKTISKLIKTIESRKYVVGGEETYNVDVHGKKASTYTPSYLLLFKEGFYSKIYRTNSSSAGSVTYTGYDWKNAHFDELLTNILTVEGIDANLADINYVNGVLNNFKVIANDAYKNQKTYTFWFQSGLYYGIYLALGVFMGLMLWLLTRGKNNPNRNLTIWVGVKISWWIDFTPGLLAMILGFVWSAAAGLAYIVLMGLRTMWLSMRSLNPALSGQ